MAAASQAAEMFGNRLAKNARHLAKWARREHVTCWRVYDRDIPEVPITVDTYEGALVVNDYRLARPGLAGPRSIAERCAGTTPDDAAWLDALVQAAKDVLGAREAHVKQRERLVGRREGHQYERLADDASCRIVGEGGHRFRVNLEAYVDTGLFLDHRVTRARAAAEPAKTMLNLFAYTGAFSVHAAAAGMATTSVDLSNTYLAWARANLAENRLDGELVQADVLEFLADARRAGRRWDLAVVDPPTFSNSKRMTGTFDVQRDHAALLADVAAVVRPGGVIWFSTNRKKFRMEYEGEGITDETHATTPPDFRHKPHRAYRIPR